MVFVFEFGFEERVEGVVTEQGEVFVVGGAETLGVVSEDLAEVLDFVAGERRGCERGKWFVQVVGVVHDVGWVSVRFYSIALQGCG